MPFKPQCHIVTKSDKIKQQAEIYVFILTSDGKFSCVSISASSIMRFICPKILSSAQLFNVDRQPTIGTLIYHNSQDGKTVLTLWSVWVLTPQYSDGDTIV